MSVFVIASIVEGHAEVAAVPILLRSLQPDCHVSRPIRVKRQQVRDSDAMRKYAALAETNITERGGAGVVLVVLDADQACAAQLGPELSRQFSGFLPNRVIRVTLAVRHFESWLVAGDEQAPTSTDEDRGGEQWLRQRHGHYSKTVDQPALTALLDHERAAARSPSFARFVRVVRELTSPGTHPKTPPPGAGAG